MSKVRTVFICQACGFESSKWLGRCPDCGEWNSLVEERQEVAPPPGRGRPAQMALPGGGSRPKAFDLVDPGEADRVPSGIGEFDRVLGGGIVPGSLVLIGGEPGIGKSTLLLEVAHLLGRTHGSVLYVSGEESERQIRLRGDRMGISGGGLFLLAETSLERILEEVDTLKPAALVVDSVQTVFSSRFPSAPGSISQVREVATQLLFVAKQRGITTFLIGHVTKDGSLAGPKSLEHIVDTVLYFEGEKRAAPPDRAGGEEPLRRGLGARGVRDDRDRPEGGAQPLGALPRRAQGGGPGLGGRGHHRGLAPDAGGGAGPGLAHLLRDAPPDVPGDRPQPDQPSPRGPREAGGAGAAGRRRVREHRRWAEAGRAGGGPRGGRRRSPPRFAGARSRPTPSSSARSAWAGR